MHVVDQQGDTLRPSGHICSLDVSGHVVGAHRHRRPVRRSEDKMMMLNDPALINTLLNTLLNAVIHHRHHSDAVYNITTL